MPSSEFLETYPLYKKYDMPIPEYLHSDIPKPTISMHCPHESCKDYESRPFKMINEYYDSPASGLDMIQRQLAANNTGLRMSGDFTKLTKESEIFLQVMLSSGAVVMAVYQCTSCEISKRIFLLQFSQDLESVQKIGQFPPWDISISKELKKSLGDYKDLYKKGLVCESQSYGIGAFSYYRRIIEGIIEELLISIEDLIEDEEKKEEYQNVLEEMKKTRRTEDKIALVKDLLPEVLRPGSSNPLSELHSILSEGLHGKSDEECLDYSQAIREILEFLTLKISQSKEANKKFTEGMKALLDKKSKKIKTDGD